MNYSAKVTIKPLALEREKKINQTQLSSKLDYSFREACHKNIHGLPCVKIETNWIIIGCKTFVFSADHFGANLYPDNNDFAFFKQQFLEPEPMYPLLRTVTTLYKARNRPALNLDDESVLNLRVGITDVDIFGELNNARHLSMMELGRWDYSQRIGFYSLMRSNKWAVVVGGASLRYRRRLPFWSRYQLCTRMLCHDGRWFYFLQETKRNKQVCSSALIKAGVSSKNGLVDAPIVAKSLGQEGWGEHIPEWIQAWIDAEGLRPWPSAKVTAEKGS